MSDAIRKIFYPSSICIAGASSKPKSVGYEIVKVLQEYGYTGEVLPVNPKADEILGYKCFHSIEEIEEKIDLAVVVVPKQYAEESIDQLLTKGVKSIVLITAGFREVGEEGEKVERRIVEKIRANGARMVGPNCMGVINSHPDIKMNATFVAEHPKRGSIALLSQSGAIGAAVLNSLRLSDIKFSQFISVGNKADISELDLLSYWMTDDTIKTLVMYLESIEEGVEFIHQCLDGLIKKPVIVLKSGRSQAGMKAAQSHTGALGSSDAAIDAVLDQFGIVRASTMQEMFDTAKGFEEFPMPKGKRVGIVTNAGGPGVLAVDALEKEGLQLAQLEESTKEKLREIVHPEGSVNNPVDLLPGGNAESFPAVAKLLIADPNVDAVISIFVEPVMVQPFELVENVFAIESEKPIFQVVYPLPEFFEKYRTESKTKKPIFRNAEEPATIIKNMLFYEKRRKKVERLQPKEVVKTFDDEKGFLSRSSVNYLAEKYDFPLIKHHFVKADLINEAAEKLDYPLVIKVVSKDVVHKSEMKGVKVNIQNEQELYNAAQDIINNFKDRNIYLVEFLIQPYVDPKFEILLGGFRDPSFGPMIMFGTGGKYVEVYKDTCMKSAYLSDDDIEEMIESTSMGRLLKGVRGEKAFDLDKIRKTIKNAAQMMLDYPEIQEFDFNPLLTTENNDIYAVDVRIRTD